MAKEWILNSVMNRFQLNYKRNVGAVSAEIRKCSPDTLQAWEDYYFKNVRTKAHIEALGKKLLIKITEVIPSEVQSITEDDCINYMINLVIKRTFDGYQTEKITIYEQLQEILGVKIEPANDEWDRLFNVDFFIKVGEKFIGIQIKPVNDVSHIPQIFKEHQLQQKTFEKFTKNFGGKVFYVFSMKDGSKRVIKNNEVINEIREEIGRLSTNN